VNRARIDHIGIAVQSLDAALEFYRDAVGLELKGLVTVPQEKVRVAMLPAGESRIELLEATSEDSPIARFLATRGEGLHHIAIKVSDLDAAIERLKAAGRRLVTEQAQTGAEGYRYVFVHPKSAHGVLLELIEEARPPLRM
jgi:methylmalonyl-CoA/ethylmalonyl-CoA epimerase